VSQNPRSYIESYKEIIRELGKVPAKIPPEIAKKIKKLEDKVKSIDLVEIMALEVLDYADFLVSECIHNNEEALAEWIYQHANKVLDSADRLFAKFYNYWLPEEVVDKFFEKVDKIVEKMVKKFRQTCMQSS